MPGVQRERAAEDGAGDGGGEQASNGDGELLKHFWDLSSLHHDERQSSADALVDGIARCACRQSTRARAARCAASRGSLAAAVRALSTVAGNDFAAPPATDAGLWTRRPMRTERPRRPLRQPSGRRWSTTA